MLQRQPRSLSLTRLTFVLLTYIPVFHSSPLKWTTQVDGFQKDKPNSPTFWIKMSVSVGLVLLGGVFSGISYSTRGFTNNRIDFGFVKSG